jgi:hypothetical protein
MKINSKYCMTFDSFLKLVEILSPALQQNGRKKINSRGQAAIRPLHILGLTINCLSGSRFHIIRDADNSS